MANPKDIGKAFKEKLKNFDRSQSHLTWEDIEPKLPQKERNRLSYWGRTSSIVIPLLLLTYIIFNAYENTLSKDDPSLIVLETSLTEDNCVESDEEENNQRPIPNTHITITDTIEKIVLNANDNNSNKNSNSIVNVKPIHNNNTSSVINTSKLQSKAKVERNPEKSSQLELVNQKEKITKQEKNKLTTSKFDRQIGLKNSKALSTLEDNATRIKQVEDEEKNIGEEAENKSTSEKDTRITNRKKKDTLIFMHPKKKKVYQKFSFGLHIAPTYNITSNGSLISDRLSDNTSTGKISLGYGITVKSYFSKKMALRVGYNHLKLSNKTKNRILTELPAYIQNEWSLQASNEIIENESQIDLIQKLIYDEISVGLQYQLSDKRQITTSLVGGLNLLFYAKNNIVIKASAGDFTIRGEDNIKKIGLGLYLGSNLKYKLSDNLFVNFDPLINYQLQEASKNLESYNLFYFTIQSGLSFEF
ncbi:hypothetical protein [Aquimarina celericrescens]|uniref:Outer membrane protein beta-barrel domain-containing protein n=1 Tax=Aquimarina celericrescens TaxID=1964542 RepID=A0ABW5AW90_9FLAO|nr:hypothetical protein [Aquimarina celericrescens]